MKENFSRTSLLFGEKAVEKLNKSCVAVFGLGGVGGSALEALVRSGVGKIKLIDNDTVAPSNINRQIIALENNIGKKKTDVWEERIKNINSDIITEKYDCFYLPGNNMEIIKGCSYVIDAIDTVSGKIALIEEAKKENVPVICAMGTGNKLDPSRFKICDIEKTSVCPLCRVMRRELKERNIKNIPVLFSDEPPIKHGENGIIGSFMPVTATAGLLIASFVIKELTKEL